MMEYPINRFKVVVPEWTECETCDRKIKTKDWPSHQHGKTHRMKKQAIEDAAAEAQKAAKRAALGEDAWNSTSAAIESNGWDTATQVADGNAGKKFDPDGCRNCGQAGHFARECTEPKRGGGGRGCHNCGQEGHISRECPEPRKPREGGGGRACHNCKQEGHISRDCPEPKIMRCRNCEREGHMSKECPEPKDWSKVQCTNCKQYGHGLKRCQEPIVEDDGGFDTVGWGNTAGAGNGESWSNATETVVEGDWNNAEGGFGSDSTALNGQEAEVGKTNSWDTGDANGSSWDTSAANDSIW